MSSNNDSINTSNIFNDRELNERAQKILYLRRLQEQQVETAQQRREIVQRDNQLRSTIRTLQEVYLTFFFVFFTSLRN